VRGPYVTRVYYHRNAVLYAQMMKYLIRPYAPPMISLYPYTLGEGDEDFMKLRFLHARECTA
jgi:hypothetical protein